LDFPLSPFERKKNDQNKKLKGKKRTRLSLLLVGWLVVLRGFFVGFDGWGILGSSGSGRRRRSVVVVVVGSG
jgi:hypothetical protein